jgi:hypothetical protein
MNADVADKVELYGLIARYTHYLDYGKVEAMDEIWAEDCTFTVDTPAFEAVGLTAVKDMLRATTAGYPQVRHVVTNVLVEIDGGGAVIHSYLQIMDLTKMAVTIFARYEDRCVKTGAGWRIHRRRCING